MKNVNYRKVSIFVSCLFMLVGFSKVSAQSNDSCFAKAPSEVAVGQNFKYTITTHKQGEVVSSDFGKFEFVSGPSIGTSTSITMINGEVDQQTTYTYTYYLQGEKEGTFAIPGVTINIDGRLVTSNYVHVNVVKTPKNQKPQEPEQTDSWFHFEFPQWPSMPQFDDTPSRSQLDKATIDDKISKDDLFVKASVSQLEAFQGEAVVVTHKLYVKGNNNGYSIERASFNQTDAFWANALSMEHRDQTTETINGKNYTVYTIKQTAFYPCKTGKLTIPKLNLTLRVRVPATVNDPFWGTYSTYKNKEVNLTSNDLTLKVKSLPGARSSETEIVGNFSMSSTLNKTTIHANEPITLTVTVSGTGNLHNIKADDLNINFPSDFDVTFPKVTGNISAKGNIVTGSKSFKYTIIPRSEGSFLIPGATYTYYDFNTGSYKTITSQDYPIEVSPSRSFPTPSIEEDTPKKKAPAKTYKI